MYVRHRNNGEKFGSNFTGKVSLALMNCSNLLAASNLVHARAEIFRPDKRVNFHQKSECLRIFHCCETRFVRRDTRKQEFGVGRSGSRLGSLFSIIGRTRASVIRAEKAASLDRDESEPPNTRWVRVSEWDMRERGRPFIFTSHDQGFAGGTSIIKPKIHAKCFK